MNRRDLIVERAVLDPEMEARLSCAVVAASKLVVGLTLDDIDDLRGCAKARSVRLKIACAKLPDLA